MISNPTTAVNACFPSDEIEDLRPFLGDLRCLVEVLPKRGTNIRCIWSYLIYEPASEPVWHRAMPKPGQIGQLIHHIFNLNGWYYLSYHGCRDVPSDSRVSSACFQCGPAGRPEETLQLRKKSADCG